MTATSTTPPGASRPPTTRQQQAQATKRRIGEAALRLFAQQGYAATSTRQIAREAGVSEGLIFRHYPAKLDLLRSVSEHRRAFKDEVQTLLDGAADLPAAVCLRAIGDGFVELVRAESQLLNVILGESRTNGELYEVFTQIVAEVSESIADYLRGRSAAGELRTDLRHEAAATALLGPLFLFFMINSHLSEDEWRSEASRYVGDLVDLWLRGSLRSPQPAVGGEGAC